MIETIGSVCSGIEAASVAWSQYVKFDWFSEIAEFPSQVLKIRYPNIVNVGDMNNIPTKLANKEINAPDMICGGTPCQAFSLAGLKKGLLDDRGNLTLKFVDIINTNDFVRQQEGKNQTVVFWENVEGVLKDKTNAFGSFISYLAGLDYSIKNTKWPNAGILRGPKRNIAWRLLDAKYFGVPQQRKRLYLLAGGKDFNPEDILFEKFDDYEDKITNKQNLIFNKNGIAFEIFREYTDCLYAAYGTKWNGNAAANNGSLFVVQNNRIRRLSPLECERLMGFPDNYTLIPKAKKTSRYQAIGNSWVVPVVKWIGIKIFTNKNRGSSEIRKLISDYEFIDMDLKLNSINYNCSCRPNKIIPYSMESIISDKVDDDIYISPTGCYGILRRSQEKKQKLNPRLEKVLTDISSQLSIEEINKKSLKQKRGKKSNH